MLTPDMSTNPFINAEKLFPGFSRESSLLKGNTPLLKRTTRGLINMDSTVDVCFLFRRQ